jgi:ankyrin repeat protein
MQQQLFPFHVAAQNNDVAGMCRCLQDGVNVNLTDQYDNTALHYATWHSNVDAVRFLVGCVGINIDARNGHDETPLFVCKHPLRVNPSASLLLAAGANPNITCGGQTLFHRLYDHLFPWLPMQRQWEELDWFVQIGGAPSIVMEAWKVSEWAYGDATRKQARRILQACIPVLVDVLSNLVVEYAL